MGTTEQARLLSLLAVCLHFDDLALPKSPKGALPVWAGLNLVIYLKPQSIYDIN